MLLAGDVSNLTRFMRHKLNLWVICVIFLFSLAGAFARIMISFDHNEHMYITAGILVSRGDLLYSEFAYLQAPYLPLAYGYFYRLFGITSHYLLVGKLFSFGFLSLSLLLIFLIAYKVSRNPTLSLGVATLLLLNNTIISAATEASNYVMPLAFSFASFFLFTISIKGTQVDTKSIFVAGVLLSIAIATRLTHGALIFPFMVTLLGLSLTLKKLITVISVYISGLIIGSLPMIYYFVTEPELFLMNNVGYHLMNSEWWKLSQMGTISFYSKLSFTYQLFLRPENLVLGLGVLMGLSSYRDWFCLKRQHMDWKKMSFILAFLLFVTATLTALLPTPIWSQYFAMPISFLLISLACLYGIHRQKRLRLLAHRHLVSLVVISLVISAPNTLRSLVQATDLSQWSSFRINHTSQLINDELVRANIDYEHRKVATLAPLFALEQNIAIYPELATGVFLFRVGDMFSSDQRHKLIATSPNTISEVLDLEQPSAIFLAYGGTLDAPLLHYAQVNGYKKIEGFYGLGQLYVYQP